MALINTLFQNEDVYKKYYLEIGSLKKIREEFEQYVFLVYDKISVIVEILNAYHDINNSDRGYIRDHEEVFKKDSNMNFYFKRWTNKRLKRIKKILALEVKSRFGISTRKRNIVDVINLLNNHFSSVDNKEVSMLNQLLGELNILESNLNKQMNIIDSIYPIKDWNLDVHSNLFSGEFMELIKKEISLIFKDRFLDTNYNNYLAVISKAVYDANLPTQSILNNLVSEKVSILNKMKKNSKDQLDSNLVTCYHARPIFVKDNLFPLDTKFKETGFFVDTDLAETINIVKLIYDLQEKDIETYKIIMPKNLFDLSIIDTKDFLGFEGRGNYSLEYSRIFKPSLFSKLNEFYIKGLISYEKVTP